MAASGFTPISLYYSTTASAVPTSGNLANGELGLNIADMKLYAKNSAGVVTLLASNAGASGSVTSVAATVPAFLSIAGSPITTSGTLAITLSGTALPVANGGTGLTTTPANGALDIGNGTGFTRTTLTAGTGVTITNASGAITINATGTGGTVTSVGQSFTGGLISVAGSPVTTSGTLALTVAGTSGGIPYFSSASTWATSAALASNALVVGGGAGLAPATVTTGTGVVTALGVAVGTAGSFVVNGGVLGTPSSGTVTNLTGTASININGTVGATTATTGAFTTLSATGVATFSAGTAALPAITTTGDTNTGIFFPAADTIAFSEGGAEAMRIDSSGNLGLGVTPSAWVSFKSIDLSTISYSDLGVLRNAFYNGSNYIYRSTAAAAHYQMGSDSSHNWYRAASGTAGNAITFTQAMTLDASGNLGVGTTSPAERLHISNGASTAQIRIQGQSRNMYLGQDATGAIVYSDGAVQMGFYTNATQRFVIGSAGQFGIGATPSYGTSGQVLTSGGSGAAPTWSTPSSGSTANAQTFTTSGTWTKPAGVTFVQVCVWGGGGGGGSGRFGASGNRGGGAGGGGGARVSNIFFAACLTSTVTVTVGTGGTGGAAKTTTSDGANGNVGGTSQFGCYVKAFGGGAGEAGFQANCGSRGGGGGGSVSAGATNTAGYPRSMYFGHTASDSRGQNLGTGGGVGSAGTGVNFYPAGASEYGGGGGGATRSQTYVAGVGGGSIFGGAGGGAGSSSTGSCPLAAAAGGSTDYTPSSGGGGAAGAGGTGGAGSTSAYGGGSGGGGGGAVACCRGYNGGAGGAYGGGGGGGGYGQVTTSGAGGTGGAGGVKVYSW